MDCQGNVLLTLCKFPFRKHIYNPSIIRQYSMPHSFSQADLAIILNSMKGRDNPRLADIERRSAALNQSGSITLEYTMSDFDIIPTVEQAIVDILAKANPAIPNVQMHIAVSPVMVRADRSYVDFILTDLFSQLFYSILEGILVSVYVTGAEGAAIVEIQESRISQSAELISNNAPVNKDQSLIVCTQLMEDMGGELLHLLNEKGNYFRLKFLLG